LGAYPATLDRVLFLLGPRPLANTLVRHDHRGHKVSAEIGGPVIAGHVYEVDRFEPGIPPSLFVTLESVALSNSVSEFVEAWLGVLLDAVILESGMALRWPSTSPDDFTHHTRYQLSVSARERRGRVMTNRLEHHEVRQIVRRLGVGEIGRIRIEATRPWTDTDRFGASIGYVEVDQDRESADDPHYIEARLAAGPMWERFGAWQNRAVGVFTQTAGALPASSGLLTVDTVPAAHEYSLGIPASVGRKSILTKVRGYAWGNILSAAHVAALGGPIRAGGSSGHPDPRSRRWVKERSVPSANTEH
jgi:hypothetical protein